MAEFLGDLATEMNLPQEQAVCISGSTVIQADKRAANDKIRGHEAPDQGDPPETATLYAQESKGGQAVVHLKLFTPDGSFTWYITRGLR